MALHLMTCSYSHVPVYPSKQHSTNCAAHLIFSPAPLFHQWSPCLLVNVLTLQEHNTFKTLYILHPRIQLVN